MTDKLSHVISAPLPEPVFIGYEDGTAVYTSRPSAVDRRMQRDADMNWRGRRHRQHEGWGPIGNDKTD